MKKSRIIFFCSALFFISWFIFEDAESISVRKFLGIDTSESIYFLRSYPVGLISLLLFFAFVFLYNNGKNFDFNFSIKNQVKIITIYLLIFSLPIILLGKGCTIITENSIVEYNSYGEIKKQYSLTDIDNVHCDLYSIRGTSQFTYKLTVENKSITIYSTDDEENWEAMIWIDTIVKTNNIPKSINASTTIEEIKNYSTWDMILNSSTGVYTHIEYLEKLLET
mgnify:CR=1 FL=1